MNADDIRRVAAVASTKPTGRFPDSDSSERLEPQKLHHKQRHYHSEPMKDQGLSARRKPSQFNQAQARKPVMIKSLEAKFYRLPWSSINLLAAVKAVVDNPSALIDENHTNYAKQARPPCHYANISNPDVRDNLRIDPFLPVCFFLGFEVQKRASSLSYCFAPISIALRPRGLPRSLL